MALALIVLGTWLLIRQQRQGTFLVQYLFFLRYPIALGLLLAAGPIAAVTAGREMFGNLFSLEPVGAGIATLLGFFAASTVVYSFNLIFALTPVRTRLPFFKGPSVQEALARQDRLAEALSRRHFHAVAILLLPLALVLLHEAPGSLGAELLGVMCGGAAAGALAALAWLVGGWWMSRPGFPAAPRRSRTAFLEWLWSTFSDGFVSTGHGEDRWHWGALMFFGLSVLVYVAGYLIIGASFASPGRRLADAVPALSYLLMLAMVFGWLLAFLSFYFDKFRVPPLVPLVAVWLVSYAVGVKDHYFSLTHAAVASTPSPRPCALSPGEAVAVWARAHSDTGARKPTMVVVAASGGGITASLWTARVLTALSSTDEGLGPGFARSITLVSSASGGGLGAAYFVDAYTAQQPPRAAARIVEAAGASSLHATAFALAYNDLFRALVPVLVSAASPDRGSALEASWRRWLTRPDVTLGGWRAGVQEGWRPTQIFNVTIAETGERLLLGPIDCPTRACVANGVSWRGSSLPDLYGPGCDVPVVTAARLSATFPWVTPLSRAPIGDKAYHLADGGYYDNFGMITAIEWLSSVHAEHPLAELVDKVLVIQIRASESERKEPRLSRGWLYATLGPLVTLLNVGTTSQRNHNDAELLGLKALLGAQHVPLETVEFELAEKSPVSWHLTPAEKTRIVAQWTRSPGIVEHRARLECLWKNAGRDWPVACGTERPIDLKSASGPAQVFHQARAAAERAVSEPGPEPAAGEPDSAQ
jgi:hypothetical protein